MIEITNLCKTFGNNIVLKDLTMTIKTGETKVVEGTTTFRVRDGKLAEGWGVLAWR